LQRYEGGGDECGEQDRGVHASPIDVEQVDDAAPRESIGAVGQTSHEDREEHRRVLEVEIEYVRAAGQAQKEEAVDHHEPLACGQERQEQQGLQQDHEEEYAVLLEQDLERVDGVREEGDDEALRALVLLR